MMKTIFRYIVVLLFLMNGFGVYNACSQYQPKLNRVSPIGVQRGTETTITLVGEHISNASEIYISGEGIRGEIKEVFSNQASLEFSSESISGVIPHSDTLKVQLELDHTASLDTRQIRVMAPTGVSNPVSLHIGDLPEWYENEPNTTLDESNPIELPVTINGVIKSENDRDFFHFTGKKGQRLICEVIASRIGSPLDSLLALFDPNGKEIARNDMFEQFDSFLDVTLQEDGIYRLSIQDVRFNGGGNYFYRLRVGELPYLDSVFPLGGRRGSQRQLKLQGRNLRVSDTVDYTIHHNAPLGIQNFRLTLDSGLATNSLPFEISNEPEMLEREPNNKQQDENAIDIPLVINGRMNQDHDEDVFSFQAKKNQSFIFEVKAQRLKSKLDSLLIISNSKGESLLTRDDAVGGDARIRFTADEDGTYYLRIKDLSQRGGQAFGYRLHAKTPQPNFQVGLSPENPRVSCGGHTAVTLNVQRREGFRGAVRLAFEGLPPYFTVDPLLIPDNQDQTLVTVSAPPDAKNGIHPIRVTAYGAGRENRIEQVVQPNPIYLTVTDQSYVNLHPVTISSSVIQGKSTELYVNVDQSKELTSPIQLRIVGLPNGVSASTPPLGEGQTHTSFRINASNEAAPGLFSIAVQAQYQHNNQPYEQVSCTIPLRVEEAPFSLDVNPKRVIVPLAASKSNESGNGSRTEEVEITISAVRKGLFTEPIQIIPKNVDEKIYIEQKTISRDEDEITLKFSANTSIPADTYQIFFQGESTVHSNTFTHRSPTLSIKFIKVK